MTKSFAAAVGKWASQSEERLRATRNRAIEMLGEDMRTTRGQGGRMPFDVGNLARSLLASTSSMPKQSEGPFPAGIDLGLVTSNLPLNVPIWLGFQAVYARRQNYGFVGDDSLGRTYNQQGAYFIEGAIAKWAQFVEAAAKEMQNSAESRK